MRVACGGGCSDAASLNRLRNTYKCSEYHYVSNDAEPHADVCQRIKAAGMIPIYDIEMAIWAAAGFNVNLDITYLRPKLAAIKAAGWRAFSSEGVSQKQVSVLREYLPYINYGGEQGEDVYASGSMYYRPRSMADGNYHECYHKGVNYLSAIKSGNLSTPNNMGLTLMLYTTASLEMDTNAMIAAIQNYLDNGVKIRTIHFWAGVSDCPTRGLDGTFNALYKALDARFGFAIDSTTKPTISSISANKTSVIKDGSIILTGKIMADGKPLANKKVTIYHTVGSTRTDDTSGTTDANGQIQFTKQFTTIGVFPYFARFDGDAGYAASASGAVNITVTAEPTALPASSVPAVTGAYTFIRGSDGGLWYKGVENKWGALGGGMYPGTAPAACTLGERTYVFVTGMDKKPYYKSYDGAMWSAWAALDGQSMSTLSAIVVDTVINLYALGMDKNIYVKSFDGVSGKWGNWTQFK